MKINEIFYSIEGEGKRVGQPAVFIRRSGCNLHCLYDGKDCDTPYRDEGTEMSVAEILREVGKYGCKNVTLTGGEPLLPHVELEPLREALYEQGYEVNIETNGTISTARRNPNEFFTVDYKCNCSGMSSKMNPDAFGYLIEKDVIKFVVSEEDFGQVTSILRFMKVIGVLSDKPWVYISPCYAKCDLQKLAEFVKGLYSEYKRVALNLQIHKFIWSPDQRGV